MSLLIGRTERLCILLLESVVLNQALLQRQQNSLFGYVVQIIVLQELGSLLIQQHLLSDLERVELFLVSIFYHLYLA